MNRCRLVSENEHDPKSVQWGQPVMDTNNQARNGRRARQTRELLQQAIRELAAEKGYEAISIRDITERAQVGRTTFYLHFKSKDDLYMSAHVEHVAQLGWSITVDSLIADEPPDYLVKFIESVAQDRALYLDVGRSSDALLFTRRMRQHTALSIEQCLRDNFAEQSSKVPFTLLANYLAGAQVSLIGWWLENHFPVDARQLATAFQRLQRASLRDALPLPDSPEQGAKTNQ